MRPSAETLRPSAPGCFRGRHLAGWVKGGLAGGGAGRKRIPVLRRMSAWAADAEQLAIRRETAKVGPYSSLTKNVPSGRRALGIDREAVVVRPGSRGKPARVAHPLTVDRAT